MNVKKKYISPKLEAVGVDRDILLVSMSSDRGDMPGGPGERERSSSSRASAIAPNSIAGDKPDFNNNKY